MTSSPSAGSVMHLTATTASRSTSGPWVFAATGVNAGRAIDIGCGCSGRFIELLRSRGFAVEGRDLSQRMLALARARHPEITFQHADICSWRPPGNYDFISAWDSIWHVPLSEHAAVLRKLLGALAPGGVMIFTMGGLDRESEKTDNFMGPEMYYSTLGVPDTLRLIDESRCVCRHLEYDQYPEQHLYVIAQRPPAAPADTA